MNFKVPEFRINFIGIGVAKSATTWVADCLRKHPDIYLPPKKELNYFNKFIYKKQSIENLNHSRPIEWYHQYFNNARKDLIKGEYSPTYMKNESSAFKIYQYNPDIKILTILRHPVERAYSSFLFRRQMGEITVNQFEKAITQIPSILHESLYHKQLKNYYSLFNKKNIKVLLYDDIQSDKRLFIEEIFSFLEVKPWFDNSFLSRSNPTKFPRFETVNQLISKAHSILQQKKLRWLRTFIRMAGVAGIAEIVRDRVNVKPMGKKVAVSGKTKAEMAEYFKEDIQQLEQLIERDLTIWK